jgi:hypothetical protein
MTEHDVSAAAVVVVTFRANQNIAHAVDVLVAGEAQRAAGAAARGLTHDLYAGRARNEAPHVQVGAPNVRGNGSKHHVDSTRTLEWRSHHDVINPVVVKIARTRYRCAEAVAQYAEDLESVGR